MQNLSPDYNICEPQRSPGLKSFLHTVIVTRISKYVNDFPLAEAICTSEPNTYSVDVYYIYNA